jgi:hypothetical protein
MTDEAPDTVTEALQLLAAQGYTAEFQATSDKLTCPVCGTSHRFTSGFVERVFRFEGPTDPGDEAIVIGVRCTNCNARGTIVSAFGPDADPETFAHLLRDLS